MLKLRGVTPYDIPTVQIRYTATGKSKWVPAREYRRNPEAGTYEVLDKRRSPATTMLPSPDLDGNT